MLLKDYLKSLDKAGKDSFAAACGTSLAYLYLISGGHRAPRVGKTDDGQDELATRICAASGWKVTPFDLRPDVYSGPDEGLPAHIRIEAHHGAAA